MFRAHDVTGANQATERQILLIGDDPMLQYSRRRMLEAAGYSVESAKSRPMVEELFLRGIELVLMCHTVSDEIAKRIMDSFTRIAPHIIVLRIASLDETMAARDREVSVPSRPAALLAAIQARFPHP